MRKSVWHAHGSTIFALALRFFSVAVADAAAAFGPAAVRSWQTNFNNELEARYPQECDIFVDYSTQIRTPKAAAQWWRNFTSCQLPI